MDRMDEMMNITVFGEHEEKVARQLERLKNASSPTYGFTGTQALSALYPATFDGELCCPPIDRALRELGDAAGFVTGGCIGVDSYVARSLLALYPPDLGYVHEIIWSQDPRTAHKQDRSLRAIEAFTHVEMPPGTLNKDRNRALVTRSTKLIAFPLRVEQRQPRSGTWQTVRMARRASTLHLVDVLEGA